MQIQRIIDWMVELAPPHLAANWDNVGLMVGDPTREVKGISLAVDPTLEAIEATIAAGHNLLITHHPLLFKAPKSLDLRKEPGRSIERLIKHDVALYAAHTNLDVTAVNLALAQILGLKGSEVLDRSGFDPDYKVAVFVPVAEVPRVQEAAWAAGAGQSARYERASYDLPARGTFKPRAGSDPAEGKPGVQEESDERRLEFLVPARVLSAVKKAIAQAHPYEEPAMDVIQLHGGGEPTGFGCVGDLETPRTLGELAAHVKAALGLPAVRVVGPADRPIRRVAWLGGSGGDYFPQALARGAEAYITGEVRHHAALDGLAAGLCYIEVGHVGSEQPVVPYLETFLRGKLGTQVPVTALHQVDPFVVI
jgi:dinuclear metal center YbgI/SA1388 family protein